MKSFDTLYNEPRIYYLPNVASCEAMLDLLRGGYHSNFVRVEKGRIRIADERVRASS